MTKIPRDNSNDYTPQMASERRDFIHQQTGVALNHVGQYSLPPESLPGNIEHFSGAAQVPIGLAGPLRITGQHANGDFFVPMATTEGTLVASYNRGMRLATEAGGVATLVADDAMQRAPLFAFTSARHAAAFGQWVNQHMDTLRDIAQQTTAVGKLIHIEQYQVAKLRWLRFNFQCGDAAGQNMVSKATRHACQWIVQQQPQGLEHFTLAANLDTDKKHSHLNNLHTRGKRAIAEVTLPRDLVTDIMRCTPEQLYQQRQYSNMGALLSGSVNNGAHFANGITALFIACGQDVANVSESSAGFTFSEVTAAGDYYFSVTIPSLIVATYGGGTGLATQKECLDMLGCYGSGKVLKLAEIVAATVLAGELSLASAIVADEWVSSHDAFGRNRP